MLIDTGLSVSFFNVLKYFVISVFLEAIVRTALNNVDVFFRALDLYHGRPVSFHPSRIDRYSLSSISRLRSQRRLFSTFSLALCAYIVEILLEFSSDAKESAYPISRRLELYQPTHGACTTLQLAHNNTIDLITDLAFSCVFLTQQAYTFYNVKWQRLENSPPIPLCVHTRDNILHKGDRIYKSINYRNGSYEESSVLSLKEALIAHSWQSNGNSSKYTVILPVTSADVMSTSLYSVNGRNYTRANLLSQVNSTNIKCVGTVFGRHQDGHMTLRLYGCFGNIPHGRNYIEASGTSLVEADAEFVNSITWSTFVYVDLVEAIHNFTSGVVDAGNMEGVQGFTMLLAAGIGKDADSVNKYAVVYKHCSDYLVPQYKDAFRTTMYDKADSEQAITFYASTWGLVLLIVWPTLLSSLCLGLHFWRKRKRLPTSIRGEEDIGRRWLARCSEKKDPIDAQVTIRRKRGLCEVRGQWLRWLVCSSRVFLNVKVGQTEDDIIVGLEAVNVKRSVSKGFKKLN